VGVSRKSCRIAITGSTGMVGTAVVEYFRQQGHSITRILRQDTQLKTDDKVVRWDILSETLDHSGLEGHDVIIHLAGANIAGQKWSPEYKRLLYSSRVDGTKLLVKAINRLQRKPKVVLSASAIGYYGSHILNRDVDERDCLGNDYLAQVCNHWEEAAVFEATTAIRVVYMRIGVVLGKTGGALAKMIPVFKWGLGGKIASGKQVMSWIALPEIPFIMEHLILHESMEGAVNLVAPHPVTNEEFTKTLGKVLKRPVVLPVPGFGIRWMLGEMGETLLLHGAKVLPKRLLESGYNFRYPDLNMALTTVLGRK